jgi:ABC-type uncharacterized transport system permease subunit
VFTALLIFAAVAFALATALFMHRLVRYEARPSDAAQGAMVVGSALVLAALLVGLDVLVGRHASAIVVLLFMCMAGSGGVLVILRWGDHPLIGPVAAALASVVTLALALHVAFPTPVVTGPGAGLITVLHVSATLVGYLLFAPAFVLANLFVSQSFRIKTKQLSNPRLPSLVTMERLAWRLLAVGFILYSLGIAGGLATQAQLGNLVLRPQHVVAGAGWLVYAGALYRRWTSGWSGVRAGVALIAGFVVTSGAVLLYVLR